MTRQKPQINRGQKLKNMLYSNSCVIFRFTFHRHFLLFCLLFCEGLHGAHVKPSYPVTQLTATTMHSTRSAQARLHSRPTIASVPMGAWVMNVLPFTDFPGLCQCLLINRHISKGVKCFLSNLVVGAEESQGWTGTTCLVDFVRALVKRR